MHRLLVLGAAGLVALVLSGSALAWSWPADGDVLRPFSLGGDAYAAGQHRGIDVAGAAGSAVVAPASGTVSFAGSLPTHGRGVTILTADGFAVTLIHLGAIGVAKGETVEEGRPVGTMGWSGEPEHPVPSVHLGVRIAAQQEGYVDPASLLPPRPLTPVAPSPPAPAPAPAPAPTPAPAPPPAAAPVPTPPPSPPVAVTPAVPAPAPEPAPTGPATAKEPGPTADPGPVSASEPQSPTAPFRITGRPASETPPVQAGRAGVVLRDASSRPAPARAPQLVQGASVRPVSTAATRAPSPDRAPDRSPPAPDRPLTRNADVGRPRTPPLSNDDRGAGRGLRGRAVRAEHPLAQAMGWPRVGASRPRVAAPSPEEVGRAARDGHRGPAPDVLAAAVALLVLVVGAAAKAARRIGGDGAVLRHHADLLRQLHAAHRSRLHDRRGRRPRTPSAAARS